MTQDTIVAIATPPGHGGVGIVRLSGSKALSIASIITQNKPLEARIATFTAFLNPDQEIIDSGLAIYFKGPNSFTGEDIVEFQGHGSPIALDMLVKTCLFHGARMARPGEFSERAFLNDKMDLTQAEAIADLIHASSQTAARMAVRSLQGDFSKKIHAINDQLIYLRLYVEAAMDFPEEEIDFLQDGKIAQMLQTIIQDLEAVKKQTSQGLIFKEGIHIVIAGRPNVGKSTLINALAGKDIAIVTDIAGTTRDIMRAFILLDDIPVHIIDTAGIRNSEDKVEQEGIKRAWQEIKESDCVLMMMDATNPEESYDLKNEIMANLTSEIPLIHIHNKVDLLDKKIALEDNTVYLSAKSGDGLDALKKQIKDCINYQPFEGQFLARRRHLDALEQALTLLLIGEKQLQIHRAGELLAEDLRLAHHALCAITGEFTADDLLGEIFSSFCIGK